MSSRLLRPIAATLILLFFFRISVQAGPVSIRDVVLVLGRYQNPSPLELRQVSQSRATPVSNLNGSAQEPSATKQTAGTGLPNSPDRNATAPATKNASDPLHSGIVVRSDEPQGTVSIIDQGDLEGTICDCGEIIVAAGGIPKWPLLFLGAIPFFFIHHSANSPPGFLSALTPTPTPTPTPQPTPSIPQVPEPSSLLLFVSGLAALGGRRLRRRVSASRAVERARAKANG